MAIRIEFAEIFLFVLKNDRLTVLAPKQGHSCFLLSPDGRELQLTDHVVTLRAGSGPATGAPVNRTEPRMANLNDVLGRGNYFLRSDAELDALTLARFELGGAACTLESGPLAPPADAAYDMFEWQFGGHFKHPLTNRASFVLQPGPDYSLEVAQRGGAVVGRWALKDGDTFNVRTQDDDKSGVVDRRTLREFAIFYDFLLDQDGNPMLGPIPSQPPNETGVARTARLSGVAPRRVEIMCAEPLCPNGVCEG